ncbi:MAG: response regulator [Bdellovibrionales bacterium]|nr:response regulator [Bdellovibrionales bacterium]
MVNSNAGRKWKLLIIDDEDLIRELINMALEEFECEVKNSNNTADGFRMAEEFRPDIIISDILMPGGTGDKLVRRIRSEIPDYDPYIILMSGYSELTHNQIESLKIDRLIEKPFQFSQIVSVVNEVLKSELVLPRPN